MPSKTVSILTPKGVDGPGKAQSPKTNKLKKRVRFYPMVEYIFYDNQETKAGELLRLDVAPGGQGRLWSHKNIRVMLGL